jgi:(E)-4-hydroxy-3-methylbut-2-enyl-diphosphate synthase
VGDVGIGGSNPLRVQSMTTTDTRDTKATCDQIERLADAGCGQTRAARSFE